MLRVLVALLTLSASALALSPPPGESAPADAVEVYVCLGHGDWCDRPVDGATVTLEGMGRTETATTQWGQATFWGVEPGTYTLTAARPGFASASAEVEAAGWTHRQLRLESLPVDVHGTVADDTGAPVADAEVRWWSGPDETILRTAADGSFHTTAMADVVFAEVRKGGYASTSQEIVLDGLPLAFTLRALPPQDAEVHGRVTDQHGTPLAGVQVNVDQGSGRDHESTWNSTRTGPDGGYSIRVHAGHLSLSAWKDGHGHTWQEARVSSGTTTTVDLVLFAMPGRTATIEGSVTDAATGARIAAVSLDIEYLEFDAWECGGMHDCAVATDDGTLSGALMPGYVVLRVRHDAWSACGPWHEPMVDVIHRHMPVTHSDGWPEARDATVGQTLTASATPALPPQVIPLPPRAPCQESYHAHAQTLRLVEGVNRIDVQLHPLDGQRVELSGYVLDSSGAPLPGAFVEVSGRNDWQSAATDANGGYRVSVYPGVYEVSAGGAGHYRAIRTVPVLEPTQLDIALEAGQDCCRGTMTAAAGPDSGMGSYDADLKSQALEGAGTAEADSAADSAKGSLGSAPTPALPIVLVLALLAAVAVGRR